MSLSILTSIISRRPQLAWRGPMLFYAGIWTAVLTVTVAVAALSPEMAFLWAISPSSSFSYACGPDPQLYVRIPAEFPQQGLCFPIKIFRQSKLDLVVPPVFAGLAVAGSAFFVRAIGL